MIDLGRKLRTGHASKADRDALANEDPAPISQHALELLETVETSSAVTDATILARDDAESLAWVAGAGALRNATDDWVTAERTIVDRARKVDDLALAKRDEEVPKLSPPAWLVRIAEVDASTWWLDLVSLHALRARLPASPLRPITAKPGAPLRLRRAHATKAADLRVYAEVIGCEDDPTLAAIQRGAVVARMFDDDVEVFAVGLRADQDDLPAGICVRRTKGGVEGIESVTLAGTAGHSSASGYWVPIPADLSGACELVVRVSGKSESLSIELQKP
jgi:hypothetical protein